MLYIVIVIIYIYTDERGACKLSLQDCHDECVCMFGTSLPRHFPRDRGFDWEYQRQQRSSKQLACKLKGPNEFAYMETQKAYCRAG